MDAVQRLKYVSCVINGVSLLPKEEPARPRSESAINAIMAKTCWDACWWVLEHSRHKNELNVVPVTSLFLPLQDFRDAFCVAGDASGRPCLYLNINLTLILTLTLTLSKVITGDTIPKGYRDMVRVMVRVRVLSTFVTCWANKWMNEWMEVAVCGNACMPCCTDCNIGNALLKQHPNW